MNTIIQQGFIKQFKRDNKDFIIIILQNISISNECCSLELSIHQGILKKSNNFHKNIRLQMFNNYNNKYLLSIKSAY